MTPNQRHLIELFGPLPPVALDGGAALQPPVEDQQAREITIYFMMTSRAVTAHLSISIAPGRCGNAEQSGWPWLALNSIEKPVDERAHCFGRRRQFEFLDVQLRGAYGFVDVATVGAGF